MTAVKRRSPGEGGAFPYQTRGGEKWCWKATITLASGATRPVMRRGYATKKEALAAMREAQAASDKSGFTEPSKQLAGDYLSVWLDGLRLAPSTVASYRKNVRLHIAPYIGDVPLASLTSARLTKLYNDLEKSGRRDGRGERTGEPLSARTVRYVHTILGAALGAAVEAEPPLLTRNPAVKAKPPTAKEAQPPEMHPWTAAQLRAFLVWSEGSSGLHAAWWTLAYTGMRRGELLALRWRDIDLHEGTISVRRSAGVVRNKGEGAEIREGTTKTNKPRVVDLDPATVAVLRAWRKDRASLTLSLVRDDALAFADLEGRFLHPERFSRTFQNTLRRCRRDLGEGAPPEIRLHDLRHTHATILLADLRENMRVVSERLGHASVTVTLTVYSHVMPGNQREAAGRFASHMEKKEAA